MKLIKNLAIVFMLSLFVFSVSSDVAARSYNFKRKISEKIVKDAYGRNNRNLIFRLADNVEWIVDGPADILPFAGSFNGKEEVQEYFKVINSALEITSTTLDSYLVNVRKISTTIVIEGSVKSTGKPFKVNAVHVWELNRRGKIEKVKVYFDTYKMVKAFSDDLELRNLQSTQIFYSYLAAQDIQSIAAMTDPGIIVNMYIPEMFPYSGSFVGMQQALPVMGMLTQAVEILEFDIYKILVNGDTVVARIREKAIAKSTGKEFDVELIHVLKFSEGKLIEFNLFIDGVNYGNAFK